MTSDIRGNPGSTGRAAGRAGGDVVDVAIVGAGPYGLAVAAHLRQAGVRFRQFGSPMRLWRTAMPRGMFLKSQGFASNISDPNGTHTLAAFCRESGRPYADYGLPVALDIFVDYGRWFQREFSPDLEDVLVTSIAQWNGGYEVHLAGGETVHARTVVVAIGVEHFAYRPEALSALPDSLSTHSSAHADLSAFRGKSVIVVGAGQSALETAALLHENGASTQLIARKQELVWNGPPLPPDRPLLARMREPEAALGSGVGTWFYSNHPRAFRHLPRSTRMFRARNALGPAGASWLRGRVEDQFPVLLGHEVRLATAAAGGVRLGLASSDGARCEVEADHVIAATGYRPNLDRLAFVDPALRSRLRVLAATPALGPDYQTSVPGLYVVGPMVAPTFGPVMRFVHGSRYPAAAVARSLAGLAASRPAVAAGAGR
jgi:thioredoxin reductase